MRKIDEICKYTYQINRLGEAVADGLMLLPAHPRRWLVKHGQVSCNIGDLRGTANDMNKAKVMRDVYLVMLKQANQSVTKVDGEQDVTYSLSCDFSYSHVVNC